jgi:hypothetical protein
MTLKDNKTSKEFFDMIRDMILFIKKWWFLEKLDKEISRHTHFQSIEALSKGEHVSLTPYFFISNNPSKHLPEYPGLAYRSIHRFSNIFWWRKKVNEDKLKKRIEEYNNLLKVCTEEGYVKTESTEKNGEKMIILSTSNSKAYHIRGWIGLINGLLEEYNSVAVNIFLPIVMFILGIVWSSNLLNFIKSIWNITF